MEREPKFTVGTQYKTRGKHPHICTIIDIHKTYNIAGELVKLRYVSTHELLRQTIVDSDVCETTVAMGVMLL